MGRKNFFVVKHLGRNVNQARGAGKAQRRSSSCPPMWPGFDSCTVPYVVLNLLFVLALLREFFSGHLVFFLSLRPTSPNSNSTRKAEDPRDNSQGFIVVCHGVHLTLVSLLQLYNHLITKPRNNNSF